MYFFFQNIDNNPDVSGFKVLNLDIRNNTYLGTQRFQFVSSSETKQGPYSTIIIGPNGTGKSYILRTILDVFREIDHFKKSGKREQHVSGEYSITYSIGENIFQIGNIRYDDIDMLDKESRKTVFDVRRNGLPSNFAEVDLPSAYLANSIMLTDKFPIVKEGFDDYVYLGVRRENSPSTAGTRTHITRTVDYAVESLENKTFVDKLSKTLDFLELQPEFQIVFTPKYRSKFFTGAIDSKYFYEFHDKFWEHTRRKKENPPWSKKHFDAHTSKNPELVEKLADFCNQISHRLSPPYEGSRSRVFSYDLLNDQLQGEEYELIKELRSLDLLSYPTINLRKKDADFDLSESSSGEAHFLSSIVALLATIKDNSLILIDEPEISLHPNWQMKYMGFLNKIFAEYKNSHFLVATHSHFLISDLDGDKSSIIGLRRDLNLEQEYFDINTYGWSAEEVLYKIFRTRTTRNYYVEMNLRELLHLISEKSKDKKKLYNLLKPLDAVSLDSEDPLNKIMHSAKKYINEL